MHEVMRAITLEATYQVTRATWLRGFERSWGSSLRPRAADERVLWLSWLAEHQPEIELLARVARAGRN